MERQDREHLKTIMTTVKAEIDEESFKQAKEKLAELNAEEQKLSPMENRDPIPGDTYDKEYARLGLIMLSDLAKLTPSPEVALAAAALMTAVLQSDPRFLRV